MKRTCDTWRDHLPADTSGSHLFGEFEARAKNVSTEVFRIPRADEAGDIILDIVKKTGARSVALVPCPLIDASGIVNELRDAGVTVHAKQDEIAEHIGTTDIGISGVEFGIAECGSVCQDALAIETRLVSTLPPLHIAFLEIRNIVPGVEDALRIISGFFTGGYISWITGPSRTADIERVLTIGVHGPVRLVVIAVDEEMDGGAA
ncbi:MAG TPA: lactate utilization protein [Syntrophales bacterium]|nr:lactate utilization protein [Syntrophales bacterium]HPQ42676.1 lactate utilization protein [Syntrophales bacterium]